MKKIIALIASAVLIGCSNPLEKEQGVKTYRISIVTSPDDTGIISPSQDSLYEMGETISLSATPAEGYVFAGWSGDISSSENPYNLTVERDYSLTANFEKKNYELVVHTTGGGAVTEEVVQEKLKDYEYGTVVRLTANPEPGYRFARWEGDIESSENPVELTIDRAKEVTAVFEQRSFDIRIQVQGRGTVTRETIESTSGNRTAGTRVRLTAEPEGEWQFVRWEGDIPRNDRRENPVVIQVDSEKNIIAIFSRKLEGIIWGERTLSRSEGPYYMSGKVRVAGGASLTMEKGVEVYGRGNASDESNTIEVFGKLKIKGSRDSEVLLENIVIKSRGNGDDDFDDDWDDDDRDDDRDDDDDWDDDDRDDLSEIEIEHAVMIGGELLPPTGSSGLDNFKLKNSFLYKVNRSSDNSKYLYVRYPRKKCTIEGNIFYNSGRIDTGLNRADVEIKNNYFYRDEFLSDETGYAVQNRAASRRSETEVKDNMFANTQGVAVSFSRGFSSKEIDAKNNYWSTTSMDVIQRMIYDSNDDWRIRGEIRFLPYRRNPHDKTPVLPDSLR